MNIMNVDYNLNMHNDVKSEAERVEQSCRGDLKKGKVLFTTCT